MWNLSLKPSDYWAEVLNFRESLMQQAEICIVASVHHEFPLPLLPIGFLSSPGLYPLPLQGCHSQSSSWSHISWLTWLLVPSAQIEVTLWHWSTSQKKDAVGAKYPKMFNNVSFLIFVKVSKEISHILQDHPRALFFISLSTYSYGLTLQAATFLVSMWAECFGYILMVT